MPEPISKEEAARAAVTVPPYRAKVMRARGVDKSGAYYYRIRVGGKTVDQGRWTPLQVGGRIAELAQQLPPLAHLETARNEPPARTARDDPRSSVAHQREPWTVRKLLEAWVGTIVRHMRSANTRKSYESAAVRLIVVAGEVRLDRVTRQTMQRIMDHLATPAAVVEVFEYRRARSRSPHRLRLTPYAAENGYSGNTINNTMAALRNAWRWAAELGHAPPLVPRFKGQPINRVVPDYIPTAEEARRVFAAIPSIVVQRALFLIFSCGCRIGEMTSRRVGDVARIEPHGDGVRVWLKIERTKTRRDRLVPFVGPAAELLVSMSQDRPADEPLFLHAGRAELARDTGASVAVIARQEQLKGRPVTARFTNTITAALQRVPFDEMGIQRFTVTALRKRFINEAMNAGALVAFVAECCGNSPQTIWKHYRRVTPQGIAGVVERVAAVDDGKVIPMRRPEHESGTKRAKS